MNRIANNLLAVLLYCSGIILCNEFSSVYCFVPISIQESIAIPLFVLGGRRG